MTARMMMAAVRGRGRRWSERRAARRWRRRLDAMVSSGRPLDDRHIGTTLYEHLSKTYGSSMAQALFAAAGRIRDRVSVVTRTARAVRWGAIGAGLAVAATWIAGWGPFGELGELAFGATWSGTAQMAMTIAVSVALVAATARLVEREVGREDLVADAWSWQASNYLTTYWVPGKDMRSLRGAFSRLDGKLAQDVMGVVRDAPDAVPVWLFGDLGPETEVVLEQYGARDAGVERVMRGLWDDWGGTLGELGELARSIVTQSTIDSEDRETSEPRMPATAA